MICKYHIFFLLLYLPARDPVLEYNFIVVLSALQKVMVPSWTEAGTRVYSQPLRLQAESLIMVPLPLPRLLSTPPPQQPWLTVMPPGSAASIRPAGHVRGTKADVWISLCSSFLTVTTGSGASTQIYY